jgi:cytochrome b involved in lipid metabolism
MVLDVTRWLPEHPGGARIIPAQSLNLDCARFFEVYHSSRESFLYLREFYIGELHPK